MLVSCLTVLAGAAGIAIEWPDAVRDGSALGHELLARAAWIAVLFAGITPHPAMLPGVDGSA